MPVQLTDETALQLAHRIQKLKATSTPLWGKMNINQMMAHCSTAICMSFGDFPVEVKFSPMKAAIARKVFIDWLNFPKGKTPTAAELDIDKKLVASDNFEEEQDKLLHQIERINCAGKNYVFGMHPIFRQMNRQKWGQLIYKHVDHHLKQFGV